MAQNRFRSTRESHQRETAEDYVEMIYLLFEEQREARTMDLAERMGVSAVTVTRTLERLKRDGLIEWQPYRSIFLTDEGKKLAEQCVRRHQLVLKFLTKLGVPEAVAEVDAEGIEHHVSAQTLQAMESFLKA